MFLSDRKGEDSIFISVLGAVGHKCRISDQPRTGLRSILQ